MQSSYFQEFGFIILAVIVVDLFLRGVALWKAARHGQKYWFIFLIIFNTIGILPGIYLLFFQKDIKGQKTS